MAVQAAPTTTANNAGQKDGFLIASFAVLPPVLRTTVQPAPLPTQVNQQSFGYPIG